MSIATPPAPVGVVAPAALARPRGFLSRLLRRPMALLALAWLAFVILATVFAGPLAPFDPLDQDLLAVKEWPTAEHLLGTDALGRDVASRLLFGALPTLTGVLQAVLVGALLGIGLGVTAGYFGGWWDRFVVQCISLLQAMPAEPSTPRLTIAAARISGLGDMAIILRHVLPRIVGPVIVQLSLFAAIAVLVQTGISFLGLGVAPPAPTWGGMIFEASASVNDFPWLLVPSGFAVALTILAFGLLGDSLRDTAVETWARSGKRGGAKLRTAQPILDAAAGSVLSLRKVTITAGRGDQERTLVHGVDLDLSPGETLGIVGESGSGKTLTILSLLGLLPPGTQLVAGTARVDGQLIDLTDEKRLAALRGHGVGMIFQEPMAALDPCFTVGHHLIEVLRLQGRVARAQERERMLELLAQVKIANPEDVARRYPHQISGGMAQRVGIARALACEPRILLADEPTTALDVTVQAEILELIRGLGISRNMAVILVTHDWGVVADLCDRAMVLYQGKVLESAPVIDLFQRPQHPYTAALLKANPQGAPPGRPLPTVQETLASMAEEGR